MTAKTTTHHEGWKAGPLPPNTWNWGGVVPKGEDTGSGFYFADFHGDHVVLVGIEPVRTLKADEVAYYNNALCLPPCCKEGEQRVGQTKPS